MATVLEGTNALLTTQNTNVGARRKIKAKARAGEKGEERHIKLKK